MKQYKILLTADRKQRVAALEHMKAKVKWPVGRELRLTEMIVEVDIQIVDENEP